MKPGARFDNPMLGGLRGRRFTRPGSAGRVESRRAGTGGGRHREFRAGSIRLHRHVAFNQFKAAPVYRIEIARALNTFVTGGRERIETRIVSEHGPIREVLRVDRSDSESERSHITSSNAVATIRELAVSTVERIVRRRQRIETRRESTLVMRDRQSAQVDIEQAFNRSAAARIAPPIAGEWIAAGAQAVAVATPLLPDLDRLTDQIVSRIDDRLIAHRERMGNRF